MGAWGEIRNDPELGIADLVGRADINRMTRAISAADREDREYLSAVHANSHESVLIEDDGSVNILEQDFAEEEAVVDDEEDENDGDAADAAGGEAAERAEADEDSDGPIAEAKNDVDDEDTDDEGPAQPQKSSKRGKTVMKAVVSSTTSRRRRKSDGPTETLAPTAAAAAASSRTGTVNGMAPDCRCDFPSKVAKLLFCTACPRKFHLACLFSHKKTVPADWKCQYCDRKWPMGRTLENRVRVVVDVAERLRREQERKLERQQRLSSREQERAEKAAKYAASWTRRERTDYAKYASCC